MKGLTKRQSEVLSYIQQFVQKNHYSPSYREIMNHFAFNSLGSVYKYVTILKRKGAVHGEKNSSRSLQPAQISEKKSVSQEHEIDLIGQINAHNTIEMYTQIQKLAVSPSLIHDFESTYALRVVGFSLADEYIMDGDILLVEARTDVHAGETIIGLINQQETVVKKYFPEGTYVRLVGQNTHHQSIIVRSESLQIQGIIVGLVRNYTFN